MDLEKINHNIAQIVKKVEKDWLINLKLKKTDWLIQVKKDWLINLS